MNELKEIMEKFASSGWDLISKPAEQWLNGNIDKKTLIVAIQQADKECGSCGCELDALYKKALELLSSPNIETNEIKEKKEILDAIAPCSLCCYTCPAKKDGVISKTCEKLLNYHNGYYEFQCKTLPRKYKHFAKKELKFVEQLQNATQASCGGCRNGEHGKCCIENCFILQCTLSHNVDFCGECEEFPCDKTKELLSGIVLNDWLKGNERIKQIGAKEYYKEITARSHYESYKKN